jgi:4'-phosphopantetheinyl transferase
MTLPGPGIVPCWRIPVDAIEGAAAHRREAVLDTVERDRLGRLREADDRRRFLAAHAGLRILLGAALGCAPHAVIFVNGKYGKPSLRTGTIEFSLSHSGRVALIALTDGTSLGADVEEIRPIPERDQIAARFFHQAEAADLALLGDAEKDVAFFRTWTRKEAVAKALGLGLSLELKSFWVSCGSKGSAELRSLAEGYPPAQSWSLLDIEPEAGHVGAIALPRRPVRIACRTLDLTAWSYGMSP